jgi:hypothetical protein
MVERAGDAPLTRRIEGNAARRSPRPPGRKNRIGPVGGITVFFQRGEGRLFLTAEKGKMMFIIG